MPTLEAMKDRIALEMNRADLSGNIASAINSAIQQYESERFWFNESRSITFDTVAAQVAYGALASAFIPYLVRIDMLSLAETSTSVYDLYRKNADEFDLTSLGQASSGKPTCFTYSEQEIRLWPTPDQAYAMRVHGVYKLATLTGDSDSNAWTTEAEELIRSAAKKKLAMHDTGDAELAGIMAAAEREAFDYLKAETSLRTGRGRILPTEF